MQKFVPLYGQIRNPKITWYTRGIETRIPWSRSLPIYQKVHRRSLLNVRCKYFGKPCKSSRDMGGNL